VSAAEILLQTIAYNYQQNSIAEISASSPSYTFKSLSKLYEFLYLQPAWLDKPDAGFAGYITYEGKQEFALFEKIELKDKMGVVFKGSSTATENLNISKANFGSNAGDLGAHFSSRRDYEDKKRGSAYCASFQSGFKDDESLPGFNINSKLSYEDSQSESSFFNRPKLSYSLDQTKLAQCYQKFTDNILKVKDYIKAGDVYQANIAAKIPLKAKRKLNLDELKDLYARLSVLNPAPYAAFMNLDNYTLLSSSPESFLRIKPDPKIKGGWQLQTSPIKGTASPDKSDDLKTIKENAEHIMILDLMRNDMSRLAQVGSLSIPKLLSEHEFVNLKHLISTVSVTLKPEYFFKNIPDLAAIFATILPAGSISGAPKIAALKIIKELEAQPRGAYTGISGYFSFKHGGEFNILIRTIAYNKISHELELYSGAGITINSDPVTELAEIKLKVDRLLKVFELDA
jgi:para-aminobenzoate synthetase component 1